MLDAYQNLLGEVGKALTEYETIAKPPPAETGKKSKDKTPSETEEELGLGEEALVLTGPHETLKEDAPVTKIVSTILRYAIQGIVRCAHRAVVSRRRASVSVWTASPVPTLLQLPSKVHAAVVARIKILAKLRLDEKRKPQDGRFSATVENRRIDFRVSTFPTNMARRSRCVFSTNHL